MKVHTFECRKVHSNFFASLVAKDTDSDRAHRAEQLFSLQKVCPTLGSKVISKILFQNFRLEKIFILAIFFFTRENFRLAISLPKNISLSISLAEKNIILSSKNISRSQKFSSRKKYFSITKIFKSEKIFISRKLDIS